MYTNIKNIENIAHAYMEHFYNLYYRDSNILQENIYQEYNLLYVCYYKKNYYRESFEKNILGIENVYYM